MLLSNSRNIFKVSPSKQNTCSGFMKPQTLMCRSPAASLTV